MDESQELPAKKAKMAADGDQQTEQSRLNADRTPAAVLASSEEDASYPPLSITRLDAAAGEQKQPGSDGGEATQPIGDTVNSYQHAESDSAQSDYSQQVYQEANPAVTTFTSQVAFPALAQSTVYSSFPQTGQTYGLPPFGALWPGIKTETGLPEAPSGGQPGFLSFSTAYTSTQSGQLHYSYPSQGSSFTTSSVYSNIPPATAVSTASATAGQQDFSSYSSLGQAQFSQYYQLPTSYTPAGLTSADEHGTAAGVGGFSAVKSEEAASAGLPPGDASPPENLPAAAALPTGGARDQEDVAPRNSVGKSKAKAKKSENSAPAGGDLERIFLWDLDETIIIFHSLLTGTYAQKFGKDPATMLNLGLQMEELIFELADTHLFFNDLEECDQVHIEDVASDDNGQDLSNYNFLADGFSGSGGAGGAAGGAAGVQGGVEWMRKLAFRYRRLKEIYSSFKGNVGGLLNPGKRDLLLRLQSDIENVTDSWLTTALKSLLLIQSRGKCVNVLVTTTQLVPALAKVLLYGLGDVFPVENIYSATKIGKESCFERIVSRFGKKVTYVVIGDGRDEEFAAKQHNMPFWRISTHGDLVSLHQALELDFL
ncbi:PREDICTED: eyes absent homolog 3-like isoform X1 [Cyprinodon variegatus]|uniref:Eyes absent homolog n=1 Tax=Cyprinodon variegatus TaxID=28743 RepID=A0A3Q2C7F4_CYPVA|nr:PREDICTED: eyes absent homolog 3-like isoform X1 [Cyprinodon variegatus]XP_015257562.1 PREDICTED: eyes absent homolog 3-like isoform X1 [Cyprinodon variegatus]